jgi:hypothetical protein
MFEQIGAAKVEQRTQQVQNHAASKGLRGNRIHASETGQPAAAGEIPELGLGLVIGMMGERKMAEAGGPGGAGEAGPADIAAGRFERNSVAASVGGHIAAEKMAGIRLGQPVREFRIGIGLGSPQPMVDVDDGDWTTEQPQGVKENH